jgi:hypothetical protein
VATSALFSSKQAQAQASGQDVATAQGLFDEGKRLMEAKKYDEGCPKLVESQRLDPAGGTLLVIALCHEAQGKTATAWAEFGVALGEARKDKRSDREAAAAQHMKAIEAKLTRLRIVVSTKVDGLEVRRDGSRVGDAQWGTPLPVDPGDHAFEARAPGKKPWAKTLAVVGEGATVDVTIPPLEEDNLDGLVPPILPTSRAAPGSGAPPSSRPADGDGSGDRGARLTWAAIVGGVGLVATGVGIGFGVSASSKWSDADKACPGGHCTRVADQRLGKDAGTAADISTAMFVVGGIGLATGLVLWLTAPSGEPSSNQAVRVTPMLTRDSGGLQVGGTL